MPGNPMNRRIFMYGAAAAALTTHGYAQQADRAELTLHEAADGVVMPQDYTGLSYESAQLANPTFFSAENRELIQIFRELSPRGVLRLGGGSSEFTTFSEQAPQGTPPFEVFGPDTSKTVKAGTITSLLALKNLRAFLDATGWRCLYGLNLGQGSKENAAREAAAVYAELGERLIALQIGNEPDSFRNRYRPASYSPSDYIAEWTNSHDAITAVVPQARFAGPDISNKLPFFTAFAEYAASRKDIVLLTAHAYAMGPAGSPNSTLDKLLDADPHVQTQPETKLDALLAAAAAAHLPYRMCEGNSCWDGGKPGVSDTLASALWCADYMLHLAQKGVAGVNLHGGGNGYYTPIAGSPSAGFERRPEYFGMQFAQGFAGSQFVECELGGTGSRVTAYAARNGTAQIIALINKSSAATTIALPPLPRKHRNRIRHSLLTGPSLDSRQTTLTEEHIPSGWPASAELPPHSAVLYRTEAQ